jgi:hypothetical protein
MATDSFSTSSRSRSPSLFSLDSNHSSTTSYTPPPSTLLHEKQSSQCLSRLATRPIVLQWKPQFFSSAYKHHCSTHLTFTALPPYDYQNDLPAFDTLSWQAAIALLDDNLSTARPMQLSIFAGTNSTVTPAQNIPIPSNLPEDLCHLLHNSLEWQLYTMSEPAATGFTSLQAFNKHYFALRRIHNGIERYIFGPAGLSIHSVIRLIDIGRPRADTLPPETLYLEEDVEIICNKAAKWLYQSTITKAVENAHEDLRQRWDATMQRKWFELRRAREIDLLQ